MTIMRPFPCRRATWPGCIDRASGLTGSEVGLSGEIRPVPNGEERLKEAATHGFKRAIVPKANAPKKGMFKDMEVIGVERLSDALHAAF